MVPRYSRPEMTAIWSAENRYRIWFAIEVFAAEAMGKIGMIPAEDAATIRAAYDADVLGEIDVAAIDAIEAVTKHDVIAFLTWAGEQAGPGAALAAPGHDQLRRARHRAGGAAEAGRRPAASPISTRCSRCSSAAPIEHKLTPTIGRSHGIHAEPMTFGLKLAQAYAEFDRNRARLVAARDEIATCAISGAVGTFANIDPAVEAHVAKELGLTPEPISTQVIPRDRHAMFFATLGVIASSIERLAIEIRHLQRTEVLEAEEYFSPGQKGSSAMPHKRNPVLTENLTGLARVVRARGHPGDGECRAVARARHFATRRSSGSSAPTRRSRSISRCARLTGVIDKLLVYPERMQKNLDRMGGLVHSQRVLLALTQAGLSREDSLCAGPAQRDEGVGIGRRSCRCSTCSRPIPRSPRTVDAAELEANCSTSTIICKQVDTIFERVFGADMR